MRNFKVNATTITTMTISDEVQAESMQQATIAVLTNAKETNWKTDMELKTNAK